jgi:hypothetical protein
LQKDSNFSRQTYIWLLSEKTKEKSEKIIVFIAIVSFVIHLLLIAVTHLGIIQPDNYQNF